MIAQELLEVMPELVCGGSSEDDMLGVDYIGLIPHLINTIKAQDKRIKELEDKVDKLIGLVGV